MQKDAVLELLKAVKYPGFSRDIVSFGMVDDIQIDGSSVTVRLKVSTQQEEKKAIIKQNVESALAESGQFSTIKVETLEGTPTSNIQVEPQKTPSVAHGNVKYIIAVASGKGGVGKSTIAANLALALKRQGHSVGLLDLDIYGPSLPMILGINQTPTITGKRKLIPLDHLGMKVMSFGFISGNETPVIWRGPMVARMTEQFFADVIWGDLDYLILDLPPGTGDVQLTLTQKVQLTGAIIVTTPQDLALADVRKGADMFRKVNAPVIGVVENMSGLLIEGRVEAIDGVQSLIINNERVDVDSDGKFALKLNVFKEGGGKKESARLDVPLLEEIPLMPEVMFATDAGMPIMESDPESRAGKIYLSLATKVTEAVSSCRFMLTEVQVFFIITGVSVATFFPLLIKRSCANTPFRIIGIKTLVYITILSTVVLWWLNPNYQLQLTSLFWLIAIVSFGLFYKHNSQIHFGVTMIIILLGGILLYRITARIIPVEQMIIVMGSGSLSGIVISVFLFGRVYPKTEDLYPRGNGLWILIIAALSGRLLWAGYQITGGMTESRFGEDKPIRMFFQTLDWWTISIGILLAVLIPLIFAIVQMVRHQDINRTPVKTSFILCCLLLGQGVLLQFVTQYGIVF